MLAKCFRGGVKLTVLIANIFFMSEELKPTNDVPAAEAKAEGQKLEWGPEVGEMTANEAYRKAEDAKVDGWRLPTMLELKGALKDGVTGFRKTNYWSRDYDPESRRGSGLAGWCMAVSMDPDFTGGNWESPLISETKFPVRLVRDIE